MRARSVVVVSCLAFTALAPTPALSKVISGGQPQLTRTVGGPGGEWLRTECDGRYLAGLQLRYGYWIDAVGINCAEAQEYKGEGRLVNAGSTPILLWGGTGGAVTNQLCSTDEVVAGMRIQRSPNNFVGFVSVLCASLNNPARDLREASVSGGAGRISDKSPPVEKIVCPPGTVAIGIHGGTGDFVDRLGLVCVDAPKFVADAPIIFVPLPPPEPIKVTGKEIGRDVVIEAYGGSVTAGSAVDPNQIPPDPISPGTVTPILIPSTVAPDICKSGYVWREARPDDHICVTPESRSVVAEENAAASSRVNPEGAYGPNTCVSGFVWREAFNGDAVCVTPERRQAVLEENVAGPSRRQ
jgi:hypothetical protein